PTYASVCKLFSLFKPYYVHGVLKNAMQYKNRLVSTSNVDKMLVEFVKQTPESKQTGYSPVCFDNAPTVICSVLRLGLIS
ncbi:MAG: hypothetical protein KAS38_16145, partial [Anaerolineales bacterium]|nr:hypothetical protein [Anaerolineales bacterium]